MTSIQRYNLNKKIGEFFLSLIYQIFYLIVWLFQSQAAPPFNQPNLALNDHPEERDNVKHYRLFWRRQNFHKSDSKGLCYKTFYGSK